MSESAEAELEAIGREAVRLVTGDDLAEHVRVLAGQDSSDRPALYFSFVIDRDNDRQRAGLLQTRLTQKLRDLLTDRRIGEYPIVKIVSRADWERREGA
ncbi:hypothetical protein [Paracraurococcus lichenis]|uniref:Uncharacterized protein n=1 Tax=Paracraurococcus lichenis TaxID=3064888 RepID=A0ABT9EAS2_9PROT|nr:hypothetical protein [Paracraurococcus sp. LOR1-02]MDO9713305.1 hypothetical protein [Paracraurococcus sp. LOR1-02]